MNNNIKKVFKKILPSWCFWCLRKIAKFSFASGERVDIIFNEQLKTKYFDIYQKSHYTRYKFAQGLVSANHIVGDFACGTGYGSVMLAGVVKKVVGADINEKVINKIKKRYINIENVDFIVKDLLDLDFKNIFDVIVSFETAEHFNEENIPLLFKIFFDALKPGGKLIFSTPFMQEQSRDAIEAGFHLTFHINEKKIEKWLNDTGFKNIEYKYQNYQSHDIESFLEKRDFIICISSKEKIWEI